MNLEGNNYDLDTLLIYMQDGEITASQLIEHAKIEMLEEYYAYLDKRGLDINEENARKFLDFWQDEERELEEEDILDDDTSEEEEGEKIPDFKEWDENSDIVEEMKLGKEATKVTTWRYRNPMSQDKIRCASETGLVILDVEKWWMTPDYINFKKGYRYAPQGAITEENIRKTLITL